MEWPVGLYTVLELQDYFFQGCPHLITGAPGFNTPSPAILHESP